MNMKIAYLINRYPAVSHSFIRREILALEREGLEVTRISIRGWDNDLVDEADLAERARTRYVLQEGAVSIALATAFAAVTRPRAFAARLRMPCARRRSPAAWKLRRWRSRNPAPTTTARRLPRRRAQGGPRSAAHLRSSCFHSFQRSPHKR